jgi:putative hemolysin
MEYIDSKYFSYADPDDPYLKRLIIRTIESLSGQPELYKLYNEYQRSPELYTNFWEGSVKKLNLNVNFSEQALKQIPKEGPLVVVANHPFGVLDGLVICWLMSLVRDDFKVLTHSLLLRAPETKRYLLPVDFALTKEAVKTNLETRKLSREFLSSGGSIVIFPSGCVSTKMKMNEKIAFDCEWKVFTSRLIKQTDATIVPIYFQGQNSELFHLASRFGLMLRSALLFREVKRRMGTDVPVTIGNPLKLQDFDENISNQDLVKNLRTLTYSLDPDLPPDPPLGMEL